MSGLPSKLGLILGSCVVGLTVLVVGVSASKPLGCDNLDRVGSRKVVYNGGALVLGGGVYDSIERTNFALQLYGEGTVPHLVLSGTPNEIKVMRNTAMRHPNPPAIYTTEAYNTTQNIVRAYEAIRRIVGEDDPRVAVISSRDDQDIRAEMIVDLNGLDKKGDDGFFGVPDSYDGGFLGLREYPLACVGTRLGWVK